MRFIQLLLLLLVASFPVLANALGLGKLELQSALNEPFNARIELISATVDELDSLNVILADETAFQRAGIPFTRALTDLRFSIKETETGSDYILIYSNDPIREPFLNFLIEVSWSKGRLFREYTALLDPPIYADLATRKKLTQRSPAAATTTGTVIREIEDNRVVYNPEYKKTTPAVGGGRIPAARTIDYTGGDYGPVVTGDTLWSIASAMRADTSVSVQQMMLDRHHRVGVLGQDRLAAVGVLHQHRVRAQEDLVRLRLREADREQQHREQREHCDDLLQVMQLPLLLLHARSV